MNRHRAIRGVWILIGLSLLALALGYAFQLSWATSTWPWPDGRLSYIFVGSILAAMAVAFLWVGAVDEPGAFAAGATIGIVTCSGMTVYLLQLYAGGKHPSVLFNALIMAAAAVFSVGLLWKSRRIPIRDVRPMPRLLRVFFVTFILALLFAATALVLRVATIFPWPLNPDSSVMFGWIFYGDLCYFLVSLLNPLWHNARAQLLSFLAYDVILIPPFIAQFGVVQPDHRLSLVIYSAVLVYSALIAIYYLFLDPLTRSWSVHERVASR